jgi:hypothetical protein
MNLTGKAQEIGWNCVAPVADSEFKVLPGTAIKAGQEVIYSKVLRKMMRFDKKSWMELVMFSLVTSTTDVGGGVWYGPPPTDPSSMTFMGVIQEAIRPIVSVLFVNYVFNVSYQGFHNPMKSFSFMDFLISLAAKDLAVGGNLILAKNNETAARQIALLSDLQKRQHIAGRFAAKAS